MDQLKFNQTGGFPLSTNILDAMQNAYSIFNALGNLAGNLAIISGCVTTGNTVSDGVVIIDGEVLNFKGGNAISTVIIKEDNAFYNFEDGSNKPVIGLRYATFGSSLNNYNWSDFTKVVNLIGLSAGLLALNNTLTAFQNSVNNTLTNLGNQFTQHINNTNNPHSVTLAQLGIIKKGTIFIGDVQGKNMGWTYTGSDYTVELTGKGANIAAGGDDRYKVTFNNSLGTNNYIVIITGQTNDSDWNRSNDIIFFVGVKYSDGFEIIAREVSQSTQNVNLDYLIMKI